MYKFHFVYESGAAFDVEGISKVAYPSLGDIIEVDGEEISSIVLPFSTMYLYSETEKAIVSGDHLIAIKISKQNS